MRKTVLLVTAVLMMSGCAGINKKIKKYEQSDVYLHSENFQGKRAEVPQEFSTARLKDFYPIPKPVDQDSGKAPSIVPPEDDMSEAKKI